MHVGIKHATIQIHFEKENMQSKAKSVCSASKGRKLHRDDPESNAQLSNGYIQLHIAFAWRISPTARLRKASEN